MLQLNTKELKGFRDTLAKWHIADFDTKDEKITKSKTIKSLETLIETNRTVIEKSTNAAEIAKREAEIKDFEAKIEAEKERVRKHIEAQKPNFEAGRNLISESLLTLFEKYLDDIYNDDTENELVEAIAKWFMEHGAVGVVASDVRKYIRPIGRKGASAKKSCETGKHTTREKGTKLRDAFLGGLCDDPALMSLLPVHSWTNKIEKTSKK